MSNGGNNDASPADATPSDSTQLTTGLTIAAIIVGLILIAAGFLLPRFSDPNRGLFGRSDFTLAICVGLSLVLAAFGTRGGVKWRGAYATGAGFIAAALFLLLNPSKLGDLKGAWTGEHLEVMRSGSIQGSLDNDDFRAIVMSTPEKAIYGAYDFSGSNIARYQFEIRDMHIRQSFGDCIAINIFKKSQSQRFYIPVGYIATFEEVDNRSSSLKWKSQDSIKWKYDGQNILSERDKPLASKSCRSAEPVDNPIGQLDPKFNLAKLFSINAAAQQVESQKSEPAPDQQSLQNILADLQSEDPLKQIAAQKRILELGEKMIAPLTEWFRGSDKTEKQKIQFLTIISLIANQSRDVFSNVIKPLVIRESLLFNKLAVDDSKSIRTMAASLLYNSVDSSSLGEILEIYKASSALEKRANLALIVSGIYDRSDQNQRKIIVDSLRPILSDANTPLHFRTLVNSFERNRDGQAKTGWVFLGSLDDPSTNKWGAKYFDLKSNKVPEVGDTVHATSKVNLRESLIEFTNDKGWVNRPATGLVQPKEKYTVTNVVEVVDGYWWAQVRQEQ